MYFSRPELSLLFSRRKPVAPLLLTLFGLVLATTTNHHANAISIKPADFDRLVMSCYLGGGGGGGASSAHYGGSFNQQSSQGYVSLGRQPPGDKLNSPPAANGPYGDSAPTSNRQQQYQPNSLGQQVPRANTIDNFIALVSKLEAASPRLASNPEQLIRALLGRFRMDNYYYDTRLRMPISDQDHRILNIVPALLGAGNLQQSPVQQHQPYGLSADDFPEHLLDHDEKCSMYFMLSHFIERSSQQNPLASQPVGQITNPQLGGARQPPSLQAAGSGYPALSANQALGGQTGPRYPGPAPAFGSPATQNMQSFGVGLSNQPDHANPQQYGVSVLQPNNGAYQQQNIRNAGLGQSVGSQGGRYPTPYMVDTSNINNRRAMEFGVVSAGGQADAAIVLNRVLMGLLAASQPPRPMRQYAELIYSSLSQFTPSTRLDNNIDPLYAVTLADLWAVGSITKGTGDRPVLGNNGRWNDTMCPTSFQLERANSIRFTTAELLGGLDGFNLGLLRRELIERRKFLRLSDLLRMYYSKQGFRGQFTEVSVCNRVNALNNHLDELRSQAEDYLRLYQLNLPFNDNDISRNIQQSDSFKELARQAAQQFAPAEVCYGDGAGESGYGGGQQQQQGDCELAKSDMVVVLDSSQQANEAFQRLVVAKLAQKAGLSRQGNSLTILTNQQDTTGYAGAYSFNSILTNSTNTAEIGCSLQHDQSRTYSGGQVTDPTRLMEMFERALVQLDSEYLLRQNMGSTSSSNYNSNSNSVRSTYASSWFVGSSSSSGDSSFYTSMAGGPKSTGGSKVIIWFNFGSQIRPQSFAAHPTNWNDQKNLEQYSYKFQEARRYLRENFRGASILALSSNRDDVKQFVFDEERDIFTDLPQTSSSSIDSFQDQHQLFSEPMAQGQAEQMVQRLLHRMCDVPAVFQYPMCSRQPSDNTPAVAYISPQRRQHWMMSPKTFFASKSVRMAFKVEGGRLRVCFGRMSRPDEFAQRNGQVPSDFGVSVLSNSGQQQQQQQQNRANNQQYLSGSDQGGFCKDVAPGQEIDFVVEEPCYKTAIADCNPFYFVIREISQPGEGDINYMCRDDGCKRLDQVKFTMSHTGVACSACFFKPSNLLLMISAIVGALLTANQHQQLKLSKLNLSILASLFLVFSCALQLAHGQQAGVHDFGQNRYGERRGNLTPSEVLAIILLVMVIMAGLALAIGLCYYISKQNSQRNTAGMTRVKQSEY